MARKEGGKGYFVKRDRAYFFLVKREKPVFIDVKRENARLSVKRESYIHLFET